MKKIIALLTIALAITTGLLLIETTSTKTVDYEVQDLNGNILVQGTTEIESNSALSNVLDNIRNDIDTIGDCVEAAICQFGYWVVDTVDYTKELVLRMFD